MDGLLGKVINVQMMANPYNWFVVWLMAAIAMIGLHLVIPDSATEKGS